VVRVVLEPKSRAVDPAVMMETLFRATQFETRFSLNMNVLDADRTPRVMGLKEVLRSWLDHRHVVPGAAARSTAWRPSPAASKSSTATSSSTSTWTR
jgi:DNA gyrase/topoisomerase IV subunit A